MYVYNGPQSFFFLVKPSTIFCSFFFFKLTFFHSFAQFFVTIKKIDFLLEGPPQQYKNLALRDFRPISYCNILKCTWGLKNCLPPLLLVVDQFYLFHIIDLNSTFIATGMLISGMCPLMTNCYLLELLSAQRCVDSAFNFRFLSSFNPVWCLRSKASTCVILWEGGKQKFFIVGRCDFKKSSSTTTTTSNNHNYISSSHHLRTPRQA